MHVVVPAAIVEVVRRDLGLPAESIRPLGRGSDHDAYAVDGGFVARVASDGTVDPLRIEAEVRLLGLVAAVSPVPVPEVVAVDAVAGVVVTTKLTGTSLLDRPTPAPDRVGVQVGALLEALRSVSGEQLDTVVEVDDAPPALWLEEAVAAYPRVVEVLDRRQRRQVERFLAAPVPAPATESVLCHNDLGAEHLLAAPDGVTLTGVLDWSDAALADPAADLGRAYRDLGPGVAAGIAGRLGLLDDAIGRAAFYARCALLEDLDHGMRTGDVRYADAALANLHRTFDEPPR